MVIPTLPRALCPLHHWHASRTNCFTDADGWQLPTSYTGVESETAAGRDQVALADVSAFAKISLLGQGVATLRQALLNETSPATPRSVVRFDSGGPALACQLTDAHLLLLADSTSAA